jgi:hypothetical protein
VKASNVLETKVFVSTKRILKFYDRKWCKRSLCGVFVKCVCGEHHCVGPYVLTSVCAVYYCGFIFGLHSTPPPIWCAKSNPLKRNFADLFFSCGVRFFSLHFFSTLRAIKIISHQISDR